MAPCPLCGAEFHQGTPTERVRVQPWGIDVCWTCGFRVQWMEKMAGYALVTMAVFAFVVTVTK